MQPAVASTKKQPPSKSEATPEAKAPPVVSNPPVAIKRIEPALAAMGGRPSTSTTVILSVLVDENGKVVRVQVAKGEAGTSLVANSIDAVIRMRYRPATRGGQPIKAWTTEQFTFKH